MRFQILPASVSRSHVLMVENVICIHLYRTSPVNVLLGIEVKLAMNLTTALLNHARTMQPAEWLTWEVSNVFALRDLRV